MTDTQILNKFISKAKGFPLGSIIFPEVMRDNNYYRIIFSHEYAKEFWGEEEVDDVGRTLDEAWEEEWKDSGQFFDKEEFETDFGFDIDTETAWRYHLQQMVLCDKPLKYLEKFLC